MGIKHALVVGAATLVLAACGAGNIQRQVEDGRMLTPEHFRDTAAIRDSDLDTVARISTEPGWKITSLLGVLEDAFLRAIIDKSTGETLHQVYMMMTYRGDWRFYTTANYETAAGPRQVSLTILTRDVLSCSAGMGCTHAEHVAFEVNEDVLREIASQYAPGAQGVWRFKFNAQRGDAWEFAMFSAEVKGYLMAVDAYRERNGLAARP